MRRGSVPLQVMTLAVAVGLLVAVTAVASGRQARSTGEAGSLEMTVGARLAPRSFPSSRQTPVRLDFTGEIRDGAAFERHPPAIRELQIESAALEVHTGGIPVCRLAQLQATETRKAEKVCGSALIGAGSAVAQVAFAEQHPIDSKAKLLVFNGGTDHGKTTLFLHAFFPNPISGAIVSTVTVRHLSGGEFGLFADAKIPQITGGSGSIVRFHFTLNRHVAGRHPISAICERGSVQAFVEGKFEDGSKATTEIVRPCAPTSGAGRGDR